jgi:undecaprenyl diphosphate synthase
VSIYAFSTENWKRGEGETGKLMKLAMQVFKHDLHEFVDRGIRVRVLGTSDGLDEKLVKAAEVAQEKTAHFQNKTLCICFNYGGQREIADAAAQCVRDGLSPEEITEQAIESRLYHPDIPLVDMVVRTSGEQRLSNFMLWRVAYSELMFIEKYWPDMRAEDVLTIIKEYSTRQRRHGG